MRQAHIFAVVLAAACLLPLCACAQEPQAAPEEQSPPQVEVYDRTADEVESQPEPEPEPEVEPEPEPEEPPFDATAPVTTATSQSGISATAPEGFLDTSAFAEVEAQIAALTESGYHVGRCYADSPDIDGLVLFSGDCQEGDMVDVLISSTEDGLLYGKQL